MQIIFCFWVLEKDLATCIYALCHFFLLKTWIQVDENMQRAQRRNACLEQKFWWRRDVGGPADLDKQNTDSADIYSEMTINEIVNGKVQFNWLNILY